MRIEQIDLKIVRLPLVRPFQTSSSRKAHLDHILVRVIADGVIGWGECASPSDPYYCPETTETCWHILKDFLAPAGPGPGLVDHRRAGGALSPGEREPLRQGGAGDGLLGCPGPLAGTAACGRCSAVRGRDPLGRQPGDREPDRAPLRPDRAIPGGRLSPDQAEDRAGLGCRGGAAGPRAISRRSRFRSTPTRRTRSTTCPRSRRSTTSTCS